ncbi:MAG: hypothetical protein AAFW81_04930 [Pseudomonadota bacterium]
MKCCQYLTVVSAIAWLGTFAGASADTSAQDAEEAVAAINENFRVFSESLAACDIERAFKKGSNFQEDAAIWIGGRTADWRISKQIYAERCDAGGTTNYEYEIKAVRVNGDIALVYYADKITVTSVAGESKVISVEDSNFEVLRRKNGRWSIYIAQYGLPPQD